MKIRLQSAQIQWVDKNGITKNRLEWNRVVCHKETMRVPIRLIGLALAGAYFMNVDQEQPS